MQPHCPRDAGKMQFLLGWGDRTCAQLASVGPQLLTNVSSSLDFRSWDIQFVTQKVVRLVTHAPTNGNALCSGGSLAVVDVQTCQGSTLTITNSATQSSDQFVMVPVPRTLRTSAGELYSVAASRQRNCLRFLSALPGCRHNILKLVSRDDGSGLQRWVRIRRVSSASSSSSRFSSSTTSCCFATPLPPLLHLHHPLLQGLCIFILVLTVIINNLQATILAMGALQLLLTLVLLMVWLWTVMAASTLQISLIMSFVWSIQLQDSFQLWQAIIPRVDPSVATVVLL